MSNRYKGAVISATAPTTSGTAYTGSAKGMWTLQQQLQAIAATLWPKGLTTPGAPTSVSASAGNAQATVTFTAPVDTGGTSITSYTVTSSPGSITGTGSASPITVTGLTNGTAYTFTVTATNAQGTGPASSASGSVTPTSAPTFVWETGAPSNTSMTFTNDNRTASNGGSGYQTAFAALPTTSGGKYYWELTETISNNYANMGVGNSTSNNQFYQDTAGPFYVQRSETASFTSKVWTGSSASVNTYNGSSRRYGFAYDVDTRKLWIRQDGGSWIRGGDPASGTDPSVTLTDTSYLVGSTYNGSDQSFTITSKTAQTDTPPSGFTAIGG